MKPNSQAGKHVSFTNSLVLLSVANAVGYLGGVTHGFLGDRLGRRNVIAFGWIISGILFALSVSTVVPSTANSWMPAAFPARRTVGCRPR
ncbi:hypothetical protein [Mycobacterium sp. URHB0021]|jgi:MFS family permease